MSENQDFDIEIQELSVQEVDQEKLQENYEQLRKITPQKIHEQTHIPKRQSEDIVEGNFESMNRIQFTGFISILEREYSLDLSALKAEGLNSFVGTDEAVEEAESKVFVTSKKTKSYKSIYIIFAVLVFLFVIFQMSSENEKVEPKIDNKKIKQVTSKIVPEEKPVEEKKEIVENAKEVVEKAVEEVVLDKEVKKVADLKIIPNAKLWVGYIDLNTGKKRQKILPKDETLELDPNTHWLLSLGHGDMSISIDGNVTDFKEPINMRFEYKDGKLQKITYKEFLGLNKGKEW